MVAREKADRRQQEGQGEAEGVDGQEEGAVQRLALDSGRGEHAAERRPVQGVQAIENAAPATIGPPRPARDQERLDGIPGSGDR